MTWTAKRVTVGAAALLIFTFTDLANVSADTTLEPTPMQKFVSGMNPANWRMPSFSGLLPTVDEKARIKKKKDGLFDEVSQSASRSWNKTKDALDPQKLNPARFFTASARTTSQPEPAEAKPGFFRSLFFPSAPEPEKETGTVTDFLRQSRPSP